MGGGGDTFFTFQFFWNEELERGQNEDRRTEREREWKRELDRKQAALTRSLPPSCL
jgi:hypothetical protein